MTGLTFKEQLREAGSQNDRSVHTTSGHAENSRSLMASKSWTPPPTRLVV